MQNKLLLWATALTVALGSMAGLAVRTARAEALPLVISAVQITGGEGAIAHDFIELYNPNPFPVDLNGYRIVKRSATGLTDSSIKSFAAETLVPAYSFYLWANSTWTDIPLVPDTATSATLANDNGVGLRFGALDSGFLVDSISWGTAANGFAPTGLGNPGASESIVRQDLFDNVGYAINPSNLRNSSVQQLPDVVPAEVDDADCEITPSQLELSQGQSASANVGFLNIGNTVWNTDGYSARQLAPGGTTSLALSSAVNPASKLELAVQINAPQSSGNFTYQWQMQKGDSLFGESCLLSLAVSAPEPDPEPIPTTVRISEFLPNPAGEDSGKEVVELYNYGSTAVELKDWVLDDTDSWPASSNALVLGSLNLEAGKYVAVTIPAGSFGLNNTGGDVLSLFNPAGSTVSTVSYAGTSAEGKTYSLVDGEWYWTAPSLGAANPAVVEEPEQDDSDEEEEQEEDTQIDYSDLVISEIYAAPEPAGKEFLELYNGSDSTINLKGLKLAIGNRVVSLPQVELASKSYYALQDAELKLPLADSGKTIKLLDADGDLIDEVAYPKAKKGESYSLLEDGFLWTGKVTPGAANELLIVTDEEGDNSKKDDLGIVKTVTKTEKAQSNVTAGTAKANGDVSENFSELPKSGETKPKSQPFNVLVIGLASLGAGILAIYKYGFGGF